MTPWTQASWLNSGLALLALALALSAMARNPLAAEQARAERAAAPQLRFEQLADGTRALLDVDGTPAPLKNYERIASGSMLSDRVLIEICDPRRIVAFTTYAANATLDGHRFAGKPHVAALDEVERLIALNPDLLLLNTHTSLAKVERLREAGITVFNMGQMRGLETFGPNVLQIAALIGAPERGQRFLDTFTQRLNRVAEDLPNQERKTAVYLTVFGRMLYGGAAHTSHHDVLTKAGLIDVAASRYEGWPRLSTVQLLELDPQIIVVGTGGGRTLCELPGTEGLRACANGRAGIIEGPQELWGDAGVNMLPATEYLFDAVYGR